MHRIRQWMSSVALLATAGLVVVAARQHLSEEMEVNPASATSEPPRLEGLPLAKRGLSSENVAIDEHPLIASARVAQHTYPIREPAAEPRQPWRGELPLEEVLPEQPAARSSRPQRDSRNVRPMTQPSRPIRAPQPVFEEDFADEYEPAPEPQPKARKRREMPEEELSPTFDAPRPRLAMARRPTSTPPVEQDYAEQENRYEEPAPRSPARSTPSRPSRPAIVDDASTAATEPMAQQPAPPQAAMPVRTPPVPPVARGQIDSNSPAMRAVLDKAREHTRHGYSLAQRGAIFSARAEFIQSLRLVAQALDAQTGGESYGSSLASGLQALEEADDFAPKGSKLEANLNLAATVSAHATPVLKQVAAEEVSPLQALQTYYAYAREQLAYATGQTVAGSEALYALGKLQTESARLEPTAERMHQAKGMAFHQAALDADSRNYQAANELAVLLARHGQWETAKRLLIHSVQLRPQAEVWRNLATVHAALGEQELAQLADNERRLLQPDGAEHPLAGQVQWVDPAAFAATGPQGGPTPRVAAQPRAPTPQNQGSASPGNWITPWMSFLR